MSSLCEPCIISKTERRATRKCEDCEELYCGKCSDDHDKFRAFKNHKVVKLEQQVATASDYENVSLQTNLKQPVLCNSVTGPSRATSRPEDQVAYKNITCVGPYSQKTDKDVVPVEEHIYEPVHDEHLSINQFTIDVDDTPLARTIGIQRQRCFLVVSVATKSITISNKGVKKFHTSLACVRRHSHNEAKNKFCFECGRASQYGEGHLYFNVKDRTVQELHQRVKQACGHSQ